MISNPDFVNWTPETCKAFMLEYQRTKDEEIFSYLLAKYDKFLLKLAWGMKKRVREIPIEDLYHSAIVGFGNAVLQFKPKAPSSLIMAIIKAYVKREIESKYISHNVGDEINIYYSIWKDEPNPKYAIDAVDILNSEILSKEEKDLLTLRFEDNMPFKDIGKQLGVCRQCVSNRLHRVINKIREYLKKE